MKDLIYRISSVWLYDNQLNHDYIFFYNKGISPFTKEENWDAPHLMFSSLGYSASSRIYNLDSRKQGFKEETLRIMSESADKSCINLIKNDGFIQLIPCGESRVSYSGATLPGQKLETSGEYKGLKKNVYTPYHVMWNETKSGINPHEFEVAGIWNLGNSQYSTYRIWEYKYERRSKMIDMSIESVL